MRAGGCLAHGRGAGDEDVGEGAHFAKVASESVLREIRSWGDLAFGYEDMRIVIAVKWETGSDLAGMLALTAVMAADCTYLIVLSPHDAEIDLGSG